MYRFANLFFAVYLADGVISLLHELLLSPPVSGLRNMVALAALLLGLPLYVALGIDRRLPKGVIIPQVLYIVWVAFGAWPLKASGAAFGLEAAVVQSLLGLLPFILYAWRRGGGRPLPEARFRQPFFGLGNTLGFFLLHLLLLPLVIGYMTLAVAAYFADVKTAGFMRIGGDGIHMQERTYQRGDKKIRLAGMVHVGEETFYHDLVTAPVNGRTVVLTEGVTDEDNLLQTRFSYDRFAELLGLTPQEETEFVGRLITVDELANLDAASITSDEPYIIHADTDLNRFAPETIEFINHFGGQMLSGSPTPEQVKAYNDWAAGFMTPERVEIVFGDLLDGRNQVLLGWLDQVLPLYDTVVIPWGALHMPGLEQAILDRGFHQVEAQERLGIDFATLLQALSRLTQPAPAPAL